MKDKAKQVIILLLIGMLLMSSFSSISVSTSIINGSESINVKDNNSEKSDEQLISDEIKNSEKQESLSFQSPNIYRGLSVDFIILDEENWNGTQKAALKRVERYLEHMFDDSINVKIHIQFGPTKNPNAGATSKVGIRCLTSYSSLRENMQDACNQDGDDIIQDWLPIGEDVTIRLNGSSDELHSVRTIEAPIALDRAIEESSYNAAEIDGSITINENINWDYKIYDGIHPSKIDFHGVLLHEVGHLFGFQARNYEEYDTDVPDLNTISVMDLFRFDKINGPPPLNDYNPDTLSEFQTYPRLSDKDDSFGGHILNVFPTIGGIHTEYDMEDGFNQDENRPWNPSHFLNNDTRVWATMEPDIKHGDDAFPFKKPDLQVLDAMGWDYTPRPPLPPEPNSPGDMAKKVSPNVKLAWYSGDDPEGEHDTIYDVTIWCEDLKWSQTETGLTEKEYIPGELQPGRTYKWQVTSHEVTTTRDETDTTTEGPIWEFTTMNNTEQNQEIPDESVNLPPHEPNNPEPPTYDVFNTNSMNAPINTHLKWKGGDPNAGDNVFYDVYFGRFYNSIEYMQEDSLVSNRQTSCSFDPEDPWNSFDTSGNLKDNTHYYWRIVATDEHGLQTIGPVWDFWTSSEAITAPWHPWDPTPEDGARNIPVDQWLRWKGGSPNPDDGQHILYEVWIDTKPITGYIDHHANQAHYNGQYYLVAAPFLNPNDPAFLNGKDQYLQPDTHYYWKIRAIQPYTGLYSWSVNDQGREVSWDFWTMKSAEDPDINPEENAPIEPEVLGPPHKAADMPLEGNILRWRSGHEDAGIGVTVTYNVYFGRDPLPDADNLVATGLSKTSYRLEDHEPLTPYKRYWWKVIAYANGVPTESNIWYFSTRRNQYPEKPLNPRPENRQYSVELQTDLSWDGGDEDVTDNIRYHLYFGETEEPELYHTTEWYDASQTRITYSDLETLSESTTYYWYVIAEDKTGKTVKSETWHFTTVNTWPDTPVNDYPPCGATNVELPVQLSVYVEDPDNNNLDVRFYDVTNGEYWNLIGTVKDVPSGSYAQLEWENLYYAKTYKWYAVAYDGYASIASDTWDFTTRQRPNDQPNQPTDMYPNDEQTTIHPQLFVNVSDPDNDTMDVVFKNYQDDSIIGRVDNVANGTNASIVWSYRDFNETYQWYVEIQDIRETTTAGPWEFTTEQGMNLDISIVGGSGRVVKSPNATLYQKGTAVELKVEPDVGWMFDFWSENLSGRDNPATIVLGDNKSVVAHLRMNDPPVILDQQQNRSELPIGEKIQLSAEASDDISLDYAYLLTNESREWSEYAASTWYDADWSHRRLITINDSMIDNVLYNFPVLVSIIDDNLKTYVQKNGHDILFVDESNSYKLYHEIESYVNDSGELNAWVRVPKVTGNTQFYMYYGNPDCENQESVEATWNPDFMMVHHFSGDDWTELKDSSFNHWDVTNAWGDPTYNIPGKISKCIKLSHSRLTINDYHMPKSAGTDDNPFTVSLWYKDLTDGTSDGYLLSGKTAEVPSLRHDPDPTPRDSLQAKVQLDNNVEHDHWNQVSGGSVGNYWSHAAIVWSPGNYDEPGLYVNGSHEGSSRRSRCYNLGADGFYIGGLGVKYTSGLFDELRVSKVPRRSSWLKAEYNNMAFPDQFIIVDSQEKLSQDNYKLPQNIDTSADEPAAVQFNWSNAQIPEGKTIGWKIVFVDSGRVTNETAIKNFTIVPRRIYSNPSADGRITKIWGSQEDLFCSTGTTEEYLEFHESGVTPPGYQASRLYLSTYTEGIENLSRYQLILNAQLCREGTIAENAQCKIYSGNNAIDDTLTEDDYHCCQQDTGNSIAAATVNDTPSWYQWLIPNNLIHTEGWTDFEFKPNWNGENIPPDDPRWSQGGTSAKIQMNLSESSDIINRPYLEVVYVNQHPDKPYTPRPRNNSVISTLSPWLTVNVSDLENDTMDISFYNAEDNQLIGTHIDVFSSKQAAIQWEGLESQTFYRWYAVANDSNSGETYSDIYTFRTNQPPEQPVNMYPQNNSTAVDLSPTLSLDITDLDQQSMNVTFFNASDNTIIGTKTNNPSGSSVHQQWTSAEAYGYTYIWYAIVNDSQHETRTKNNTFTTKDLFTLETSAEGQGTVTRDPDQTEYLEETQVKLTAIPENGWRFSHWTGDGEGNENPCMITITKDTSITAEFYYDSGPEWRNQSQNRSVIRSSASVKLAAEGREYSDLSNSRLDYAYLSTNESDHWVDYNGDSWWNSNWKFKKKITVNHSLVACLSKISDFPVFVNITDIDLKNHAQSDADDIVFVNELETTKYYHEIEYYNASSGVLIAWVRLPRIHLNEDTIFYMYYGNEACSSQQNENHTWDENFVMVHHLQETEGTHYDSTNYTNHGSIEGDTEQNISGFCDGADYFDSDGDRVNCGSDGSISFENTNTHTFEAWVKAEDGAVISKMGKVNRGSWKGISPLFLDRAIKLCYDQISGPGVGISISYNLDIHTNNAWHYLAVTYDGSGKAAGVSMYVDGEEISGVVDYDNMQGSIKNNFPMQIGDVYQSESNNGKDIKGTIDEVRVSKSIRSSGYIKTTFNSIKFSNQFLTVDNEEQLQCFGGSKYGSPIDFNPDVDPNIWQEVEFLWSNEEIADKTNIDWKITFVNTSETFCQTDCMSFSINDSVVLLEGDCFYDEAKTQPADLASVEIRNVDTGRSWDAIICDNQYQRELIAGEDINASETICYIAKDTINNTNVTTYQITTYDIDNGTIYNDLILDEYYLDLSDFPYYPTENHAEADKTYEQMTGPACLEMATDYMFWNTSTDPGTTAPRYTQNNLGDQLWIYNEARSLQTNTDHTYVSARGMQQFLQNYMPQPYGDYGYNFNIKHTGCPWNDLWTQDRILGSICIWTDYSTSYADGSGIDGVALKPGHKPHVPAFIPAFGDYGRWMAVRGVHTDKEPWIFDSTHQAANDEAMEDSWTDKIKVYGFWVNDPFITGIGENSYKTGTEFKNTYFVPISASGDAYNGEYAAVVEPPQQSLKQQEPEVTIVEWPTPFSKYNTTTLNVSKPPDVKTQQVTDSHRPVPPRNNTDNTTDQIIKAAEHAISRLTARNSAFAAIYSQSYPQQPVYVNNYQDDTGYYIVPYATISIVLTSHRNQTPPPVYTIAVLIDAETGQFKELSWVKQPVRYLTVHIPMARLLVFEYLIKQGYTDIDPAAFNCSYIYRKISPFLPEIKVITPHGNYYVTQDKIILQ